jgi:hypothetical protein
MAYSYEKRPQKKSGSRAVKKPESEQRVRRDDGLLKEYM